jgi:16S rRNA (uracil1498-N3)-methyltransferase
MQRFFIEKQQKNGCLIIFNKTEELHQMKKVLRLKEDAKIICLENNEKELLCQIKEINKKEIICQVNSEKSIKKASSKEIVLVQALPKNKEKWELILQKASELGVKKIIPLESSRCQNRYEAHYPRALKIIKEACEQSERSSLTILENPYLIKDLVKLASKNAILFCADSYDKDAVSLLKAANNQKSKESFYIIIGPEGGFEKAEIEEMEKFCCNVSLGTQILRTETASIASLSVINAILADQ